VQYHKVYLIGMGIFRSQVVVASMVVYWYDLC